MSSSSRSPVGIVVLTCGDDARRRWGSGPYRLAGQAVDLGARPGRAEIDPLLADAARLVVAGDDAALAAVLVRLLRRERLDVELALLPAADSVAATVWGVPTDPDEALALAREGTARAVPLVRDDRGGVVAGSHRVGTFTGAVYCDATQVCRGDAAGLVVHPDPVGGGVRVTVTGPRRWGGLRPGREAVAHGRAVQIGCRPAQVQRDGVTDERPLERRSWYRHTEDWRLALRAR